MARLLLKFDKFVIKEVTLPRGGVFTIGRLPDNFLQVDNLAVSGHHAKIFWELNHYVVQDMDSLNGTYVNKKRVANSVLKDGDVITIGKHSLLFKGETLGDAQNAKASKPPSVMRFNSPVSSRSSAKNEVHAASPAAAKLDSGFPQVLAAAVSEDIRSQASTARAIQPSPTRVPQPRLGILTIVDGKTDEPKYWLADTITTIGKSELAAIKLKGWFSPKNAAVIDKRDNKYFIAAFEKDIKLKVNDGDISGPRELSDGDVIEVAGIKMTFGYQD